MVFCCRHYTSLCYFVVLLAFGLSECFLNYEIGKSYLYEYAGYTQSSLFKFKEANNLSVSADVILQRQYGEFFSIQAVNVSIRDSNNNAIAEDDSIPAVFFVWSDGEIRKLYVDRTALPTVEGINLLRGVISNLQLQYWNPAEDVQAKESDVYGEQCPTSYSKHSPDVTLKSRSFHGCTSYGKVESILPFLRRYGVLAIESYYDHNLTCSYRVNARLIQSAYCYYGVSPAVPYDISFTSRSKFELRRVDSKHSNSVKNPDVLSEIPISFEYERSARNFTHEELIKISEYACKIEENLAEYSSKILPIYFAVQRMSENDIKKLNEVKKCDRVITNMLLNSQNPSVLTYFLDYLTKSDYLSANSLTHLNYFLQLLNGDKDIQKQISEFLMHSSSEKFHIGLSGLLGKLKEPKDTVEQLMSKVGKLKCHFKFDNLDERKSAYEIMSVYSNLGVIPPDLIECALDSSTDLRIRERALYSIRHAALKMEPESSMFSNANVSHGGRNNAIELIHSLLEITEMSDDSVVGIQAYLAAISLIEAFDVSNLPPLRFNAGNPQVMKFVHYHAFETVMHGGSRFSREYAQLILESNDKNNFEIPFKPLESRFFRLSLSFIDRTNPLSMYIGIIYDGNNIAPKRVIVGFDAWSFTDTNLRRKVPVAELQFGFSGVDDVIRRFFYYYSYNFMPTRGMDKGFDEDDDIEFLAVDFRFNVAGQDVIESDITDMFSEFLDAVSSTSFLDLLKTAFISDAFKILREKATISTAVFYLQIYLPTPIGIQMTQSFALIPSYQSDPNVQEIDKNAIFALVKRPKLDLTFGYERQLISNRVFSSISLINNIGLTNPFKFLFYQRDFSKDLISSPNPEKYYSVAIHLPEYDESIPIVYARRLWYIEGTNANDLAKVNNSTVSLCTGNISSYFLNSRICAFTADGLPNTYNFSIYPQRLDSSALGVELGTNFSADATYVVYDHNFVNTSKRVFSFYHRKRPEKNLEARLVLPNFNFMGSVGNSTITANLAHAEGRLVESYLHVGNDGKIRGKIYAFDDTEWNLNGDVAYENDSTILKTNASDASGHTTVMNWKCAHNNTHSLMDLSITGKDAKSGFLYAQKKSPKMNESDLLLFANLKGILDIDFQLDHRCSKDLENHTLFRKSNLQLRFEEKDFVQFNSELSKSIDDKYNVTFNAKMKSLDESASLSANFSSLLSLAARQYLFYHYDIELQLPEISHLFYSRHNSTFGRNVVELKKWFVYACTTKGMPAVKSVIFNLSYSPLHPEDFLHITVNKHKFSVSLLSVKPCISCRAVALDMHSLLESSLHDKVKRLDFNSSVLFDEDTYLPKSLTARIKRSVGANEKLFLSEMKFLKPVEDENGSKKYQLHCHVKTGSSNFSHLNFSASLSVFERSKNFSAVMSIHRYSVTEIIFFDLFSNIVKQDLKFEFLSSLSIPTREYYSRFFLSGSLGNNVNDENIFCLLFPIRLHAGFELNKYFIVHFNTEVSGDGDLNFALTSEFEREGRSYQSHLYFVHNIRYEKSHFSLDVITENREIINLHFGYSWVIYPEIDYSFVIKAKLPHTNKVALGIGFKSFCIKHGSMFIDFELPSFKKRYLHINYDFDRLPLFLINFEASLPLPRLYPLKLTIKYDKHSCGERLLFGHFELKEIGGCIATLKLQSHFSKLSFAEQLVLFYMDELINLQANGKFSDKELILQSSYYALSNSVISSNASMLFSFGFSDNVAGIWKINRNSKSLKFLLSGTYSNESDYHKYTGKISCSGDGCPLEKSGDFIHMIKNDLQKVNLSIDLDGVRKVSFDYDIDSTNVIKNNGLKPLKGNLVLNFEEAELNSSSKFILTKESEGTFSVDTETLLVDHNNKSKFQFSVAYDGKALLMHLRSAINNKQYALVKMDAHRGESGTDSYNINIRAVSASDVEMVANSTTVFFISNRKLLFGNISAGVRYNDTPVMELGVSAQNDPATFILERFKILNYSPAMFALKRKKTNFEAVDAEIEGLLLLSTNADDPSATKSYTYQITAGTDMKKFTALKIFNENREFKMNVNNSFISFNLNMNKSTDTKFGISLNYVPGHLLRRSILIFNLCEIEYPFNIQIFSLKHWEVIAGDPSRGNNVIWSLSVSHDNDEMFLVFKAQTLSRNHEIVARTSLSAFPTAVIKSSVGKLLDIYFNEKSNSLHIDLADAGYVLKASPLQSNKVNNCAAQIFNIQNHKHLECELNVSSYFYSESKNCSKDLEVIVKKDRYLLDKIHIKTAKRNGSFDVYTLEMADAFTAHFLVASIHNGTLSEHLQLKYGREPYGLASIFHKRSLSIPESYARLREKITSFYNLFPSLPLFTYLNTVLDDIELSYANLTLSQHAKVQESFREIFHNISNDSVFKAIWDSEELASIIDDVESSGSIIRYFKQLVWSSTRLVFNESLFIIDKVENIVVNSFAKVQNLRKPVLLNRKQKIAKFNHWLLNSAFFDVDYWLYVKQNVSNLDPSCSAEQAFTKSLSSFFSITKTSVIKYCNETMSKILSTKSISNLLIPLKDLENLFVKLTEFSRITIKKRLHVLLTETRLTLINLAKQMDSFVSVLSKLDMQKNRYSLVLPKRFVEVYHHSKTLEDLYNIFFGLNTELRPLKLSDIYMYKFYKIMRAKVAIHDYMGYSVAFFTQHGGIIHFDGRFIEIKPNNDYVLLRFNKFNLTVTIQPNKAKTRFEKVQCSLTNATNIDLTVGGHLKVGKLLEIICKPSIACVVIVPKYFSDAMKAFDDSVLSSKFDSMRQQKEDHFTAGAEYLPERLLLIRARNAAMCYRKFFSLRLFHGIINYRPFLAMCTNEAGNRDSGEEIPAFICYVEYLKRRGLGFLLPKQASNVGISAF